MFKFFNAILFAFKNILDMKMMKIPLISGLIVNIVWILIAISLWDIILGFSGFFLDLLPFSMLQSDGAWIFSTLLWTILVLLTFSIVFAFLGNFIFSKLKKEKYAFFSILIAIASAAFWTLIWFFQGEYIHAQFAKLLVWLPFETTEKAISYIIAGYFVYSAIIVSLVFVSSIWSRYFLKSLNQKYYPDTPLIKGSEIKTIKYTIKDAIIFTLASFVLFPLFFIPILNFILQIVLWVWLIKDTAMYDTASVIIKDLKKDDLKEYRISIWFISAFATLFNFIPVFNLFAIYFAQLAMFHLIKNKNLNNDK